MRKFVSIGALLCAMSGAVQTSLGVAPSIEPLTTFGGGDGWIAAGERSYLTTGSLQRGLAYNPATGNLLVVNRSGGLSVNIINGTTGANVGTLSLTNVFNNPPLSGIFALNMIAATERAIYAVNLADISTAQFKIFSWDSESDPTASLIYNNDPNSRLRLGDTLDARPAGLVDELVVGMAPGMNGGPTDGRGYSTFQVVPGEAFGTAAGRFDSTPPNSGDHRLGITFGAGNTMIGTQGGPVRVSAYPGFGEFGPSTLLASPMLTTATERPMDFAEIDGLPVLATVDTDSSIVRIYDFTDPSSPLLLDAHTNIVGSSNSNDFGVGQVRFGAITGNTATLYALNTNNGIQAFTVTVPEPTGAVIVGSFLMSVAVKRRRESEASTTRAVARRPDRVAQRVVRGKRQRES